MKEKIKTICLTFVIVGLFAFYIQPVQAGFFSWFKSLFVKEEIQETQPASISEPLKEISQEEMPKEMPKEEEPVTKTECPVCPKTEVIIKEVPVEKIITKEIVKEIPVEKEKVVYITYKDNPEQEIVIKNLHEQITGLKARIKQLEQKLIEAQEKFEVLTSCEPSQEICDGMDNDCNGQIDENLTRRCGTSDIGICEYGTSTCTKGYIGATWGQCVGGVMPSREIYDKLDNDCDGSVDEDFERIMLVKIDFYNVTQEMVEYFYEIPTLLCDCSLAENRNGQPISFSRENQEFFNLNSDTWFAMPDVPYRNTCSCTSDGSEEYPRGTFSPFISFDGRHLPLKWLKDNLIIPKSREDDAIFLKR